MTIQIRLKRWFLNHHSLGKFKNLPKESVNRKFSGRLFHSLTLRWKYENFKRTSIKWEYENFNTMDDVKIRDFFFHEQKNPVWTVKLRASLRLSNIEWQTTSNANSTQQSSVCCKRGLWGESSLARGYQDS